MKAKDSEKSLNSRRFFSRAYMRLTACVLILIALVLVFTALDDEPLLQQRDALTGLSTRAILLVAGIIGATVSPYLFVARALMTNGLLVSWLSLNLIIYRIGMNCMNVSNPNPTMILTGWKIGIWPRILDGYLIALIIYLAIGGLLITALEWRVVRIQRAKASSEIRSSQNLTV